jgi:hypothetical protein
MKLVAFLFDNLFGFVFGGETAQVCNLQRTKVGDQTCSALCVLQRMRSFQGLLIMIPVFAV